MLHIQIALILDENGIAYIRIYLYESSKPR